MLIDKTLLPCALLLLSAGAQGALAAPKAKAKTPAPIVAAAPETLLDVSTVKGAMSVVTDGKGHYVAYGPLEQMSEFFFYGDGKSFWKQRVFGGGSEGGGDYPVKSFSRNFWEPRVTSQNGGEFEFRNKQYSMNCNQRLTAFTVVPAAEAKAMVEAAKFHPPRWKWRAHFVARDERGNYYYVDQQREPEDSKNFRLFVGPKGNLKLQNMTNVVSDTEGEIFATKTGSLRLITGKKEWTWMAGAKPTKLTYVPVDGNAAMIYSDLGVYVGENLGTPCDDM